MYEIELFNLFVYNFFATIQQYSKGFCKFTLSFWFCSFLFFFSLMLIINWDSWILSSRKRTEHLFVYLSWNWWEFYAFFDKLLSSLFSFYALCIIYFSFPPSSSSFFHTLSLVYFYYLAVESFNLNLCSSVYLQCSVWSVWICDNNGISSFHQASFFLLYFSKTKPNQKN